MMPSAPPESGLSSTPAAPAPAPPSNGPAKRARDPRLDFFRGIAMFIIFVAHVPINYWTLWIPARFGFSDATEIFVFCSGMASALAFGTIFARSGWWIGTARIAHRIWQIYWAHIALFFVTFLVLAAATASDHNNYNYLTGLNLAHTVDRTVVALTGLFTLTWVPNYFDILPMYMGILALLPFVVWAAHRSRPLAAALVLGLWLLANLKLFGWTPVQLPAEPWSGRPWFFNPLGWQLVFFTGFAFMAGWLPAPPRSRRLALPTGAIVILTIPVAWSPTNDVLPFLRLAAVELKPVAAAIQPLTDKTSFGLLRYVHFLALAYLAWLAVGPQGARLSWGPLAIVVDVIRKVGQQSLAVFLMSLVLARFAGVVLDVVGITRTNMSLVNLAGFAILIATAYIVSWFKSEPWRRPASTPKQAAPPLQDTSKDTSAPRMTDVRERTAPQGIPAE